VNGRESGLGDLDTRAVQVLLQTGIELGEPTVFEVGDTLLLVLDITAGSEFVGRHRGWLGLRRRDVRKGEKRGVVLDRQFPRRKKLSLDFQGNKGSIQKEGEEVRERMSDKAKVNLERDFLLGPWASPFLYT
jgi:hypothetical protein